MRISTLLPLLLALSPACDAPPRPTQALAPRDDAPPRSPDADATADRLRDAIRTYNPEDCVGEAEALLRGPPSHPRLRAWAIDCVAEAGQFTQARELAASMQRELPGEPWADFAALAVDLASGAPEPSTLPRSAALLSALGDHEDALRLRVRALQAQERNDEVLELARRFPDSAVAQDGRVRALFNLAFDDPTQRPAALAAARQLVGITAISGAYVAAYWLWRYDRHHEALAAIDLALADSPRSVAQHRLRWSILFALPDRSEAQRQALVADAISDLLVLRSDTPAALLAAAEMYRQIGLPDRAAPLEARLLPAADPTRPVEDRGPDGLAASPAAEALLLSRLETRHYQDPPGSPEEAAQHQAQLTAAMARPRWHDLARRERVAQMHFDALRRDPGTPPESLLAAVEAMLTSIQHDPRTPYSFGARALAERTPYLERAEAIAREGLVVVEAFIAARRQAGSDAAVLDQVRDDMLSTGYDALGVILTASGRLDEADAALTTAHGHGPEYPPIFAHRAALAERRGDREAAIALLIAGREYVYLGAPNPCDVALEAMYRAEHGSLRGYPRYVEQRSAALRERRRAAVLATVLAERVPPPPFALEDLHGVKVTSEALRGKITVIKFWFIHCVPCTAEMPEFQALADAYARDPAVRILSISTDDAASLREWMSEHGHRFEVLPDQGYAGTARVHNFPTLWVLDREGRIAYTRIGTSRHLREEFTWRIDSLRQRG